MLIHDDSTFCSVHGVDQQRPSCNFAAGMRWNHTNTTLRFVEYTHLCLQGVTPPETRWSKHCFGLLKCLLMVQLCSNSLKIRNTQQMGPICESSSKLVEMLDWKWAGVLSISTWLLYTMLASFGCRAYARTPARKHTGIYFNNPWNLWVVGWG